MNLVYKRKRTFDVIIIKFFLLIIIVGTVSGCLDDERLVQENNYLFIKSSYQVYLPLLFLQPIFYSCENNIKFNFGSYLLLNNQWNRNAAGIYQSYQQCIYSMSTSVVWGGWSWSWPNANGLVKAYPEIIYGWAPWLQSTTDSKLPVQLSKMGSFQAIFDTLTIGPGATYNTAFDIWITSSGIPTTLNRTREIMIWIDYKNPWVNPLPNQGRVIIDGQEYDVTKNQYDWSLIVFKKVVPMPIGSINIDHFLNFLVSNGQIGTNEFLADIELGNEIVFGTGRTTIRSYSILTSN